MDETVDNHEESAPKRSRSDEEIKSGKEASSSGDSGQQSPHEKHKQQQEDRNVSAYNNNNDNINNNNNHLNNNSDSGLSLKMEDSSCGDADITEENGISKYENDDDIIMAALTPVDGKQRELNDQQMSTNDSIMNNEEIASVSVNVKETASGTTTGDIDKPTTSSAFSTFIKRHKRNRSRNYRVSGRSSSSSSQTSQKDHKETAATQEQVESQESTNSVPETPLPANKHNSRTKVPPNFSERSLSFDGSVDSDDDDRDSERKAEKDRKDQRMSTNDSIMNNEEIASVSVKDNETASGTTTGEIDKPSTSTAFSTFMKRHERNRSRNFRLSSSSSESSQKDRKEAVTPQEQGESQESTNPVVNTPSLANDNETEESTNTRRHLSLPIVLPDFSESSISFDSSTNTYDDDDDDDDTDFEPSFLSNLRPFDVSNDSEDSSRLKEKDEEVNKVLNKQKPAYTWCASYELMRREHGLSGDGRTSLRNGCSYGFKNRFYASRHIVERMKISHVLRKHSGCVNCLNFNKSGDLLVTGSDDARLIVWDWAANKTKHVWKSGHSANIFQSKFLPSSACIDIISAGRDGKVRRSVVPPSGGKVQVSQLYVHAGAVHKLVICPDNPSEVISVGEDGLICSKDLREDNSKVDMSKVVSTTRKTRKVRLFSISHHPFAPEICVSGGDQYVRVYDKRSMKDPIHLMSPEHILETNAPNVTCCVYNNTGTEILATYSEDNIYLFNNKNYISGEYLHSYKGHFNQKTIKGVNFFGPNCEYVISGSDCSNIFFWDKNTEAILNFMPGDTVGVVNCLEPHPSTPILATSGLDHNIKIWTPNAEKYPPDLTKLTNCVRRNVRRTVINDGSDLDSQHLQSLIRQILGRSRYNRRRNRSGSDAGSDGSTDSSEPSLHSGNDEDNSDDYDLEDEDVDVTNLRHLTCGTQ